MRSVYVLSRPVSTLHLNMIAYFIHPYFHIRMYARRTSSALGPPINQSINHAIKQLIHSLIFPLLLLPLPDLLRVGDRRGHRVRAVAEPRPRHGLRLRHHANPPGGLQDLPHGQ